MADVATPTRPRQIPNVSPRSNLTIAPSVPSSYGVHLAISPVTQGGSYEFDRIIKAGEVFKRTRKTKSWKPIYIVLRPNLLSIYRNKDESKLRHQVRLAELTAVARQRDPKRKDKHMFGLFSPSRNYHLEAPNEKEAQRWVELIRREARMDQNEEEVYLASPGGSQSVYFGFGRSIDEHISPSHDDRGGYSSSDIEALAFSQPLPKTRDRTTTNPSIRKPSQIEYSGPEYGSISDFSDTGAAARMSALSLAQTDGRPSTSSMYRPGMNSFYGLSPARPSMGARNPSQLSNLGLNSEIQAAKKPEDDARVITHGWIYLLKSKSGVRHWKKVWMVLRPKALALYKNEEEYSATLVLELSSIIDVVEIDAISRSKSSCMQVLSQERNYRFCALDEESLAKWLGAFKSLLRKRKANESTAPGAAPVIIATS